MCGRVREPVVFLPQRRLFVGVSYGRRVEFLHLVAEEVDLSRPGSAIAAELVHPRVDRGHLGARPRQGLDVDRAERIERGALDLRAKKRLMGVLPVQVDDLVAHTGEGRDRSHPAVHVGSRSAAARGDDSRHHRLAVALLEATVDDRLAGAGPDEHRIGATANQQVDGFDNECLAGSGLAGEYGHARPQHQREVGDHT